MREMGWSYRDYRETPIEIIEETMQGLRAEASAKRTLAESEA